MSQETLFWDLTDISQNLQDSPKYLGMLEQLLDPKTIEFIIKVIKEIRNTILITLFLPNNNEVKYFLKIFIQHFFNLFKLMGRS